MAASKSRQSAGRFFVSIFGAIIGAASTLFVYPYDMPLHGMSMFILNTSMILVPVFLLGFNGVAINNYNEFKTEDRRDHGFLGFLLLFFMLGAIIYAAVFMLAADRLSHFFTSNKSEYNKYFYYILPVTIFSAGTVLLDSYLNNFFKIIIPSFIRENLIKISLPILIYLCYLGTISIQQAMWGIVLNYFASFTLLLGYAFYLRPESFRIDFSFITKERLKRIGIYGLIASLGSIGSQLVGSLDIVMIKAILPPLELISVFNMHFTLASFVFMPFFAIASISGPMIAKYLHEGDTKQMGYLYQVSTTVMLIIGLYLFLIAILNLPDIYTMMPNGDRYAAGWSVFLFLGLARLVDLGTGLNAHIIGYSKYYRVILYTTLSLGALNFLLNYFLIHRYGINGAAISSFIAIVFYNVFKVWFVYKKFGILPIDKRVWRLILLTLICLLIGIIPLHFNAFANIALRATIITGIYWSIILRWHISPHINHYVYKYLTKVGLHRGI
ncbi:MAG TPA: polysaccharide biosynthesis C-terminal domain-containing protein [Saprospiraceae bacterium]|nr:polysaccharide biosynthesis C-terminal domain-containing protein [Saprospiraceae bacterium]